MHNRRTLLKGLAAGFVLKVIPIGAYAAIAPANFIDVRLWPAEDYTRVTLEHDGALKFKHFVLNNPWRLVVDLLDMKVDGTLEQLASKLEPNDPYIRSIRVGQFDDQTIRLVFDLKTEVVPQVFTIGPAGEYKDRFVIDFYPKNPVDPLLALLDKTAEVGFEKDELAWALSLAGLEAGRVAQEKTTTSLEEAEVIANAKPQPKDKPSKAKAEVKPEKPHIRRMITVAIDPGHGGEDPGAVGRRGAKEKDVVLAISQMLKREIDQIPGMRAMLTRNDDFFVPLGSRVAKARAVKADLFVSVHADAFIKPTASGSSVFVLSDRGASSTTAKWLANKENESDLIGGVNLAQTDSQLAKVLLDLSTTAQISDSMKLGSSVLAKIGTINKLHKPRVEQAGFAVLKAPDIPSILIETAFISNPEEEKKLKDKRYQQQMARAISEGIQGYFAENPPVARSGVA